MRIRSHLGWLQATALSLFLLACDDGESSSGGGPTCAEVCDDGGDGEDASGGSDASGGAVDSGNPGSDSGVGSDTGVDEPDSASPMECDCGADAGDPGDAGSDGAAQDSGQQDVEMAPSCTDGSKNGTETDMDCGGSCSPCAKGLHCAVAGDCAPTLSCGSTLICATGPTAGFTLAAATGLMPFNASASSTATAGDTAIVTTEYNWGGAGAAFEVAATHRYKLSGTYAVRQRVTDSNGLVSESAAQTITVSDYAVRFSATDKTAEIALTNNRLDVGINNNEGGVRSDAAIAPGSGVFYFESKQLFAGGTLARIGVGTGAASLTAPIGEGESPSLGASTAGLARNSTFSCTGSNYQQSELGWVIDYRAATPRVHVITDNGGVPDIGATCTSTVTAPLFIMYGGQRSWIGPALRINTGSDTTNHPFHFPTAGVRAALTAHSEAAAAAALVPGFGKTRAGAADAAPVVSVMASATTVAIGTPVTLTATATDALDGVMTAEVQWLDASSQFWSRANGVGVGTGPMFTFTPDRIGQYPIEASVTDSSETTTTTRVMINVTGTLQSFNPVQLIHDPLSDPDTQISPNGLGARFVTPTKHGVRANQGIARGDFWYFEAHRVMAGTPDLGAGLVIKGGNIHPYSFRNVPWSASINMGAGIWRNLISVGSYRPELNSYYGFAVDYRGEHPIVYVIHNEQGGGQTYHEMTLDDVWEPLYPMLYGNAFPDIAGEHSTIKFTAPFQYNPTAVLGAKAVGLELGWGI